MIKLQFWIHNSILIYQGGNFCQWKRLTMGVLSICENLRVKGHQMIKHGQKRIFGAICTLCDLGILSQPAYEDIPSML